MKIVSYKSRTYQNGFLFTGLQVYYRVHVAHALIVVFVGGVEGVVPGLAVVVKTTALGGGGFL